METEAKTSVEPKHTPKTWEECCDEFARKLEYDNYEEWEKDAIGKPNYLLFFKEAADLFNSETAAERDWLKEELRNTEVYLKQMIEINVANMAFESGEDWKKNHKVEDGESFPHWFMRHHSVQMEDLKEDNNRLIADKEQLRALMDNEINSLKQLNSELAERLINSNSVMMNNEHENHFIATVNFNNEVIDRAKQQ